MDLSSLKKAIVKVPRVEAVVPGKLDQLDDSINNLNIAVQHMDASSTVMGEKSIEMANASLRINISVKKFTLWMTLCTIVITVLTAVNLYLAWQVYLMALNGAH